MAYAIGFSEAARRAFERIDDLSAQERVLDEIDRLADAAAALPRRPLPLVLLHDVRIDTSAANHYIFLTAEYDPARQAMTIVALGHYARPTG